MAKGSGLSFDSDRIGYFFYQPTVINSFPEDTTTNHRYHHHNHHHPKLKLEPMEATTPTIKFPVNLNSTTHDEQDVPTPSHDDKRRVIDEMDFFAHDKHHHSKAAATTGDENDLPRPAQLDFNVNTGLHLLTAANNTGSDESMVDDETSPNSEDKRAKTELTVVQAELKRMNTENQRLRDMLDQVTGNYTTLQIHMMTLMQQKHNNNEKHDQNNMVVDDKSEENNKKHSGNNGGGLMVPRQFMDLGLAATADTDEHSLSSSEPVNNGEAASKEGDDGGREESPENGSNNKVARLNGLKNVDQAAPTEATMRKARVSVRARSEAPMFWGDRLQMDANGGSMDRKWRKGTRVLELIIVAPWLPDARFGSKVQRCAEDRTILITTYEGNHNHPLPPAAMAMASTTSSAAQMLLSGSMSSADGLINSNFIARTLLPCSSNMATISASAPFPTVTLDLTQSPNNPLQFQRQQPQTQFHIPFPNPPPHNNNLIGQALYNQSKFSGLQMSSHDMEAAQFGRQALPQSSVADTVNALTADPNFTAALAAAISSLIGGGGSSNNNASVATTTTSNNNSNDNNSSFPEK
ncbi:unnamed protein product [Camellia sinensis]